MRIGRLTVWGGGLGKIGMGGLGSATILGAGRRTTMAAGFMSHATVGAGIPERLEAGIIGRPRWWHFSDLAAVAASAWALGTLDGCRLRRVNRSIAGGAADIMAGVTSTVVSTLRT